MCFCIPYFLAKLIIKTSTWGDAPPPLLSRDKGRNFQETLIVMKIQKKFFILQLLNSKHSHFWKKLSEIKNVYQGYFLQKLIIINKKIVLALKLLSHFCWRGVGKIFGRPVYDGFYEEFKPYLEKNDFTFFNINDINANFINSR